MESLLNNKKNIPLADNLRPKSLDDVLGQDHLLGKGKFLRKLIEEDSFTSFILWGPPGSGKTTIIEIIFSNTQHHYLRFPAVTSSIVDVKKALKESEDRFKTFGQKTIIFIDEIHRFNKAQQDAFLPYVENGSIILLGATTMNPYFEIISALNSRVKIFKLNQLTRDDIKGIILKALSSEYKEKKINITDEALEFIINTSSGDARVALNTLELAASSAKDKNNIDVKGIEEILGKRFLRYDKNDDQHYAVISAFIKSMRGSDPNAAVYWLSRMLEAGEDPRFIVRRMIIAASEDVGMADPWALMIAVNAYHALEFVGLPEAKFALYQAAIHISCAPKSNSVCESIGSSTKDVSSKEEYPVPLHLINQSFSKADEYGIGVNYKYPHNYPGNFIHQQYLPDNLTDKVYYSPSGQGFEEKIKLRLRERWPGKYKKE
ncbi:MAG: replication-associated recombination protein A [Armatimonadota bacterium]